MSTRLCSRGGGPGRGRWGGAPESSLGWHWFDLAGEGGGQGHQQQCGSNGVGGWEQQGVHWFFSWSLKNLTIDVVAVWEQQGAPLKNQQLVVGGAWVREAGKGGEMGGCTLAGDEGRVGGEALGGWAGRRARGGGDGGSRELGGEVERVDKMCGLKNVWSGGWTWARKRGGASLRTPGYA